MSFEKFRLIPDKIPILPALDYLTPMQHLNFQDFKSIIAEHTLEQLTNSDLLQIGAEGNLQSLYAPFDAVNTQAKIVIVGICLGQLQWKNALETVKQAIVRGDNDQTALIQAKRAGAFSGPMRANLIKILDHVGLQSKFGINSTAQLFDIANDTVHMTSVLKHCILSKGKNYSGTSPNMLKNTFLKQHIDTYFVSELAMLPPALYIPMGKSVTEVLYALSSLGYLSSEQILDGFPHPSGANAERIAYFLGQKPRASLSAATDADSIDQAKTALINKLQQLPSVIHE